MGNPGKGSNTMKRFGKALFFAGVLLVGAILLIAGNSELRDGLVLIVDPGYFREEKFSHCRNGAGQEIFLLGTIHTDHLTNSAYSLWNIKAVILHGSPDLLLVESRPEEMERGNIGDGPVEMPFATLVARHQGIEVQGMDWWTMEGEGIDNTARENRMFENILRDISGHGRVLILTGWSHVEGFRKRLASLGCEEMPFSADDKRALFDTADVPEVFPEGMADCIERRMAIDGETLANETRAYWKSKLENAIRDRKWFLTMIRDIGER